MKAKLLILLVGLFAVLFAFFGESFVYRVTDSPPVVEPPLIERTITLSYSGKTFTESEYATRVRGQIDRYGYEVICIGHISHLQRMLPERKNTADWQITWAVYNKVCQGG